MDEQSKVNALVNVGQMKVVEKAYDDIISNPAKRVGNALETVLDIGNTLLWPVKWANERTRIFFENNLKKYQEKLSTIPEDKITPVPSEIAIPILERFTYVSNEELSNAFIKLLASASIDATAPTAHPGFIHIIDRLSPDEAKILEYLKDKNDFPRVNYYIRLFDKDGEIQSVRGYNESGLQNEVKLSLPQNVPLYIDNISSLGLIKINDTVGNSIWDKNHKIVDEIVSQFIEELPANYKPMKHVIQDAVRFTTPRQAPDTPRFEEIEKEIKYYSYSVTKFGKMFIQACIAELPDGARS